MDLDKIKEDLEQFGSALLKSIEENICLVTKSHAERIIDKVTHIDELDNDELSDFFVDLGKTVIKKLIDK